MNRKNGFLAFCCACVPGCGEMYLGYMKRGLSVMLIFWGICGLSSLVRLSPLLVFAAVAWFFGFFDTFNLRNQTPQQFYNNPDAFLIMENDSGILKNNRRLCGILLIVLGAYLLYDVVLLNIFSEVYWNYPDSALLNALYDILSIIPSVLLAIALVVIGVRLIKPVPQPTDEFNAYAAPDAGEGNAPMQSFVQTQNTATGHPKARDAASVASFSGDTAKADATQETDDAAKSGSSLESSNGKQAESASAHSKEASA